MDTTCNTHIALDSQLNQPLASNPAQAPQRRYIGIDIAQAKFDCALLIEGNGGQSTSQTNNKTNRNSSKPSYKDKQFPNNNKGFVQFTEWLKTLKLQDRVQDLHICMEATGVYSDDLAAYLIDLGLFVSVVNPARIVSFIKCDNVCGKTDIQDARSIALYCARMQPAAHQIAPRSQRVLLHLARQRQHLKETLQAEQNRLSTCDVAIKASITKIRNTLAQELKKLEGEIMEFIKADQQLKRNYGLLITIPGVGWVTAMWMMAYLGDGNRFERGKQVAKFAGLAPREWLSGSSVRGKTSISKAGGAELRKMLYMPATSVFNRACGYPEFTNRLKAAGKVKMQIIVAVMRKILTIAQAVLRTKVPFDRKFHTALA